jgi:hypothetical protein
MRCERNRIAKLFQEMVGRAWFGLDIADSQTHKNP